MSKLTDLLPGFYAELHAKGAFRGDSWRRHAAAFQRFLGPANRVVVDFGCGPAGGLAEYVPLAAAGVRVVPHDPYVPAFAGDPWKEGVDALFSCDVFEHMPAEQIHQVLRRLCKSTTVTHAYVVLSTRPATKTLPNGLNCHVTVKPAAWWQGFLDATLGLHFDCRVSVAYVHEDEAVFGFVRRADPAPPPQPAAPAEVPPCASGS